jgi:chromosome partitioning protein
MKKTVTICIANHKGGVGKTTTAVNLATGLAGMNYPTVLIDCDPQGDAVSFLNLEAGPALYDLVVRRARPGEIVQRYGETKLGVVANEPDSTTDLETLLRTSSRVKPDMALRQALAQFASQNGKPTIVIIDTAPSLSAIQIMALYAADWLLIPASPEYASENGIAALTQAVTDLAETGANLQLLGILPTMFDGRYKDHNQTVPQWEETFPGLVLPVVRKLSAIAQAPGAGVSIWEYAPKSEAAGDYMAVLEEVKKRVGI